MQKIADRERTLRELVKKGVPLRVMAESLPSATEGKIMTRQRVLQILRNFNLHQEWVKQRKLERERLRSGRAIEILCRRPRGRIVAAILQRLESDGYTVRWGSTIRACAVEGFPITVHVLINPYGGRFHAFSINPATLRICLFPTGRIIMIMPEFGKKEETMNFPERMANGPSSLVPRDVLRFAAVKHEKTLTENRLTRYARAHKYKLAGYQQRDADGISE